MICTNDLLIIIGSIIKQLIESKSIVGDMWDVCSLMLGENLSTCSQSGLLKWINYQALGTFWFGLAFSDTSASSRRTTSWSSRWRWPPCTLLRGVIFDPQGAAPNMLRFLICASLLYIGFAFAGWVTSPFVTAWERADLPSRWSLARTTSNSPPWWVPASVSSGQCRITFIPWFDNMYVYVRMYFDDTFTSLINGDDMFATFNSIPMERALPVWVYRFQTSALIRIYQLSSSCNFFSAVSTSTSSSVCSSTWCSPCSSRSSWTPTRSSRTAMTKASRQIGFNRFARRKNR